MKEPGFFQEGRALLSYLSAFTKILFLSILYTKEGKDLSIYQTAAIFDARCVE
jgi:hypothetical protein